MSRLAVEGAAEVEELANEAYRLARTLSRDDLTDAMEAQSGRLNRDREHVAVVVVGDIKRGKSSLINAVLGRPQLLPVDNDVATSVRLIVRHADEPIATVTRQHHGEAPVEIVVPMDELARYGSEQGDPAARAGVVQIEIGVPDELLRRGLAILDTPGFGSMTRGHRDATLAALGLADVLLFTLAADAPVRRSELEFLGEAVLRVGTVVLAVTKTDSNPDWRDMVTENRARIAEHARQVRAAAQQPGADPSTQDLARHLHRLVEAEFVPVSARLALAAGAARGDAADRLRVLSGIDGLVELFDRITHDRHTIRLTSAVQLADSVLAALEVEQDARLRSAEGDTSVDADLARQQQVIEQVTSQVASWRDRFGDDVNTAAVNAQWVLARELRQVRRSHVGALESGTVGVDAIADDLERSLLAAWTTVATSIATDLEKALAAVRSDLGADELCVPLEALAPPSTVHSVEIDPRGRIKIDLVDDGMPALVTTSAMGSLIGIVLPVLAGPAGWIAGALVGGAVVVLRRTRRSRRQAATELADALRELQQQCANEISVRLAGLRRALDDEVVQRAQRQLARLEDERKTLSEMTAQDAARRDAVRRSAGTHLAEVRRLRERADEIRRRLSDTHDVRGSRA